STLPNSSPRPSSLAHHSLRWKPLPQNSAANRTGGSEEALRGAPSSPQTGDDSSHGRAIDTPTPRRNVRRERGCTGIGGSERQKSGWPQKGTKSTKRKTDQ